MWIGLSNKILRWDNGRKRNWIDPGRCVLCKDNEETTDHLSVKCPFLREVWNEACQLSNGQNR